MEIGKKMIKLNWKYRILLTLFNGVLFVVILLLIDYFFDGDLQSVSKYMFQGVFFGLTMGFGFPYVSEKFAVKFSSLIGNKIKPDLENKEIIEFEGPANLFRGIESVGGKLFLTKKRIIFKSHNFNIQTGQTNIDFDNVSQTIKRKTGKIIDNGIRILTKDGKEFDFVLNERDVWIEKINKLLKEC